MLNLILIVSVLLTAVPCSPERCTVISAGTFTPLYGVEKADDTVRVGEFLLDRYPVSNREFRDFVAKRKDWRPGSVPEILSDPRYLTHWEHQGSHITPKDSDLNKPVVHVSWFAAQDFCAARGGRLPTVNEWEYTAAASETKRDASRDPVFVELLLTWYSKPSSGTDRLPEIGRAKPNIWGVYDLHGVVWEWTADFNSVFVLGDNRNDGEKQQDLFCGAGAASGTDKANYAAFMRYALRNSLKGRYTTANLGFRCAYNAPSKEVNNKQKKR